MLDTRVNVVLLASSQKEVIDFGAGLTSPLYKMLVRNADPLVFWQFRQLHYSQSSVNLLQPLPHVFCYAAWGLMEAYLYHSCWRACQSVGDLPAKTGTSPDGVRSSCGHGCCRIRRACSDCVVAREHCRRETYLRRSHKPRPNLALK